MDFDSIYAHIDEGKKNDGALGKCKKYTLKYANIWTVLTSHLPTLGLRKDLHGRNGKRNKIPRPYQNEYRQPTTPHRTHGADQDFFHSSGNHKPKLRENNQQQQRLFKHTVISMEGIRTICEQICALGHSPSVSFSIDTKATNRKMINK